MYFREFVAEYTLLEQFLTEAVAFKHNVTRNKEAVLATLDSHLRRQAKNGVISFQTIADTIRHQFTNYDQRWHALDANKADMCEYFKAWKDLCIQTADAVKKFVEIYLPPNQHSDILAANQRWLQQKLQSMVSCEDEDPRKWRNGWQYKH